MSKISFVIVEDSRLARNELKELIKEFSEFTFVGEAENVDNAYHLIDTEKPDLIFLDINLPEKNGFDLLEMLHDVPMVIFTTAYDEFAIKSFEYNTLDYLLKPISDDRFKRAIEKVKTNFYKKKILISNDKKHLSLESQIFIKDGEKCGLVKIGEIQLLEIIGNYTKIHFNDSNIMHYKSLNQIELKLPESNFFRVNRQQIINTSHIQKITPWTGGKLKLIMKNGCDVEVSRRQSYLFKDRMSL